jgi:PAS domain S-box-containing protein
LRLVFSPPWTGRAALLSLLILALALCASASGLCPPAQDPAHRSNRDKIVVGTLAPFRVRGLLAKLPSGETGGFALELTRAAAAAVGLEVEFKEVDDHETALRLLIDSSIDVICLLSVTDERMPLVEFSTPLLIAHGAVFSRIGDTPATTAEALSKVGVTVAGAGVAHQWCIEQSIPVMVEPSLQVALERVVRGEARYCLTTQIAGRVDVEDHKIVGLVDHPLEDERISRAFALATRKGETELRFDLNKGLAIVRDNGRWDQLYDEWVARYQPRPRRPYVTRSAVLWGGGILFALMSAGLLSQWLLRRQISRRTSELRQSEAMYRAIAEDLPALVYTYFVSDDGRRAPRYISPQAAEWRRSFPYLEPGQEWKSYLDRVHPDDQQGFSAAAETAQAKRARFDRECQLVAQDGSYRWVHILVTPFPAEGGTLWQGLLLDVTPLRETEQALRASEQKYRVIFERSQDALLLVDPRTLTLRSMNAAACKLYGYSNAELVGSPLARIQALGQLGPQVIAEVCSGVARTGIRDAHTQRDGTRIEVEISVAAMVLENETLVLAEVRDISERMRLELQLFQAQKLEGLGVLAGGIAHDFNNLMGGILGNVELARAHLADSQRARRYLTAAEGATQRAAELTQQLLAYAGKVRLSEERIELGGLAREMVELIACTLHRAAVLHFDLDPRAPTVIGDPTLVRQVVMNLVANASDSLGPAGGEIWLRSGTRHFDREYLTRSYVPAEVPAGEYVYLEIEDSGCGIAEEQLALIFDPFFSTKFTGRGLGLSVVLKTMQRHRGAVKLSSKAGQGTRFQLLFPPAAPAAVEPEPAETEPMIALDSMRVLVVDDDPMVREVVSTILENRGWQVATADDGDDALRLQREDSGFDLVLLDLTMPGKSGAETLRELLAHDPATKVVLMSGFEARQSIEADAAQTCGFLQKPFTGAKLVLALELAARKPARKHGSKSHSLEN